MPQEPRAAMNLQPGDEIEVMGNWWIVQESKIGFADFWPSDIYLLSRDRSMSMKVPVYPTQIFNCEPHCC